MSHTAAVRREQIKPLTSIEKDTKTEKDSKIRLCEHRQNSKLQKQLLFTSKSNPDNPFIRQWSNKQVVPPKLPPWL